MVVGISQAAGGDDERAAVRNRGVARGAAAFDHLRSAEDGASSGDAEHVLFAAEYLRAAVDAAGGNDLEATADGRLEGGSA